VKKLYRFLIAILIIGTYVNDGFAQEKKDALQGFWKSNIGNIVKIDGGQGVLVHSSSEPWNQLINKPIIRNIRQHYDRWVVEERIRADGGFHWIEINWKLVNNRITKDLMYLRDEEKNYYEKISDDLNYKISDEDTAAPADHEFVKIGRFDVAVGLGKLGGHTTYQRGGFFYGPWGTGTDPFPLSRLEFPLDVYMASLEVSVGFAEKLKLSASVKKNITDDAGKMEDSDWGIYFISGFPGTSPGSLDIYSESDASLDALIVDVSARYRFYRGFFVGLGYLHQNFDYEISNLHQWWPSSYSYFGVDLPHIQVDGPVITYEVTYSIPYIELAFLGKATDRFTVETSLGFSPFVNAEDEDNHLLRSKVSKADYDPGSAILLSVEGRYKFATNWFLALQFDYTKIEADGESLDYVNGVYAGTIYQETKSEQIFYSLNIGYAF